MLQNGYVVQMVLDLFWKRQICKSNTMVNFTIIRDVI